MMHRLWGFYKVIYYQGEVYVSGITSDYGAGADLKMSLPDSSNRSAFAFSVLLIFTVWLVAACIKHMEKR